MNKALILFSGLFLVPVLINAQQEKVAKNRNNSLTITIAPAFFATMDEKLDAETFWPASLYVTKNFILNKRLSISAGGHFLYKRFYENSFVIGEMGYSGPVKTTSKYFVFDIPFRLNYHIIKPNDKVNLYLKTEIKNSLIINYFKGDPDFNGEHKSSNAYGYNMFLGIGFGLDFKVVEKLSFVLEPGLNYSVIGILPGVGLIDCQLGVKYDLFKK
jgi:hypothetical protein